MEYRKGHIIELAITSLAYGGAGVGRHAGMAVFVKDTVPGERVRASFTRIKSQYAEAALVEVLEGSPFRVAARCRYAGVCGGCQMQHIEYRRQLEYKRQHVIDAFERIGHFTDPPVGAVLGMADDESFYYRNKIEFSFGYDAHMQFRLGMHVPGRKFDIMDIEECYLESSESVVIVNAVREFCEARGWLPFQYSDGSGMLKHLIIREGKRTGERMVILVTGHEVSDDFPEGMRAFVEMLRALPVEITSIYWLETISRRGVPRQVKEHLLDGAAVLRERMELLDGERLEFSIGPQAFFQVNTQQAEVLYSQVVRMADEVISPGKGVVFDLFCGTGTIGLFLAKHALKVYGIELNAAAALSARENALHNHIENIEFLCGDVAEVMAELPERPELIVVDPPRAGLTPHMISQINDFGCGQMIYVSCNPATLARDCAQLREYGFGVCVVQPVDMFPHTYHIECVVLLTR